ncbi:MAG TPA: cyclic-phosphate processing receiver domain-containing protein [Ohtaekwangia sp.]|uniref:cyclic-phosphate processing receiver domain-containing protein n=1 Tax=Ohtaekwangia sp. TaxID=2066019 RepID=UPI002F9275DE
MEYKLFLDDIRSVQMIYPEAKDTDFVIVRSYDAFVKTIQETGLPAFISFDNDLGCNADGTLLPEGYDAAKWLVYESELDLSALKFYVHSSNPVAKSNIESLLNNYIRFLKKE